MSSRSAMSLTGDETLPNWYSSTFKAADLRQEAERRGLRVRGKTGRAAAREDNLGAIYLSEIDISEFSRAIQSDFKHFSRWLASQTLDGMKRAVAELEVEIGMTKSINHRLALQGLVAAKGILPDCVPPNNFRDISDSNSHTSASPFRGNAVSSHSILDTQEPAANAYVRKWASEQGKQRTASPMRSTSTREDDISSLSSDLQNFHVTNPQTQTAPSYEPFTYSGQPGVSVPKAESVLGKLIDVGIPTGGAGIQSIQHMTSISTNAPPETPEVHQARYPAEIVTPSVQRVKTQSDDIAAFKPLLLSLAKTAITRWPEEFTVFQSPQSNSNDASIAWRILRGISDTFEKEQHSRVKSDANIVAAQMRIDQVIGEADRIRSEREGGISRWLLEAKKHSAFHTADAQLR